MQCEFCGFANGDDDHRCLRCGRRTTGHVVAAPASYVGNNALAMDAWALSAQQSGAALNDTQDLPLLRGQIPQNQPPIPAGQKIIPFNQIPRQSGRPVAPPEAVSAAPSTRATVTPAAPKTAETRTTETRKRQAGPPVEQGSLDFTPVAAAPARTLTNGVPASNYCQRPVATVSHRFFASVVDTSMILIGFVLLFGTAQATGSLLGAPEVLGSGKPFLILMAAFLFLVTTFYGILWLFARRETAGMRMAGLELITFDNSPLDPVTRLVRVAATWLSICSCGLGVIWAIADEEKLTWQDHISKSFPTFRETGDSFVNQRR